MTASDTTKYICFACVEDKFLSDEIKAKGNHYSCDYCESVQESISLRDLADRIHGVLQRQFIPASMEQIILYEHFGFETEWEWTGYVVTDVIADIVGLSEDVACELRRILSEIHGYSAVKGGEEDPYGIEARYEEKGPNDGHFKDTWSKFREEVVSQARFFSRESEEKLNEIFGNLGVLRTTDGEPVVRELSPGCPESAFWRARRIVGENGLTKMLRDPTQTLGPPPSGNAGSGRMNPRGIPVFYGATSENTCLSEIRAPVGSRILIGNFALLRPARLLDFEAMTNVFVETSHFDPNYEEMRGRASFLGELVAEISKPVMPEDEEFEYIPTQVVAEYLANRATPQIDGILYPSSQTDGNNVVLFNHASKIKPYGIPKETEIEVYDWSSDEIIEYLGEMGIDVNEVTPDNCEEVAITEPYMMLELDQLSVRVLDIKSVEYAYDTHRVHRIRSTASEEAARKQSVLEMLGYDSNSEGKDS